MYTTSRQLAETVAALRLQIQACAPDAELASTGVSALDRLLPEGGLRLGSLVEYLGHGAPLALATARAACQERILIVVDRQRQFNAVTDSPLIVLRPENEADEIWALDQALRCPGVGAVWVRCGRLKTKDFRRLQLAAECGGVLGLLVRPAKLRGQPTWADVQWLIEPQPSRDRWRLRAELVRCRGGTGGGSVVLELDETNTWQEVGHANSLHSPAELADSTAARRRSHA